MQKHNFAPVVPKNSHNTKTIPSGRVEIRLSFVVPQKYWKCPTLTVTCSFYLSEVPLLSNATHQFASHLQSFLEILRHCGENYELRTCQWYLEMIWRSVEDEIIRCNLKVIFRRLCLEDNKLVNLKLVWEESKNLKIKI